MLAFDHYYSNQPAAYISIDEDTVTCQFSKITDASFSHFPVLRFHDLVLENCAFANCHTLHFSDCKLVGCQFIDVETLYADNTPIDGCDFEELRCDNDCILSLEDSEVSFCNFKDVVLTNEAYLVNGCGDVWIESCSFENISTDREDRELFFCEEIVGKIFKKTVQFRIADTASCTGLDNITCTVEKKTPEHPMADLWVDAMKRGIVVEKAMEAMRSGIGWDESKWDARSLGLLLRDQVDKLPVYTCLTSAGLRTVGDLVRLDFDRILKIKHLSKTVVKEVVTLLHDLEIHGSAWDYLL